MADLGKEVGQSGGTMKILMAKPKDIRMMVIYSGTRLVSYNDSFKLSPDLLKSIDVVDSRIFTLHLRKGPQMVGRTPVYNRGFSLLLGRCGQ